MSHVFSEFYKPNSAEWDFFHYVAFALPEGTTPHINSTRFYMLTLYSLIQSNGYQAIAELGVFRGLTTQFLAKAAKATGGSVEAYDIEQDNLNTAKHRVEYMGLGDYVTWFHGDLTKLTPSRTYDFIFMDNDHSYEGTEACWNCWAPSVRPGGCIAIHDTSLTTGDPRAAKFIKDKFPVPGWEHVTFPGDCGLTLAVKL